MQWSPEWFLNDQPLHALLSLFPITKMSSLFLEPPTPMMTSLPSAAKDNGHGGTEKRKAFPLCHRASVAKSFMPEGD